MHSSSRHQTEAPLSSSRPTFCSPVTLYLTDPPPPASPHCIIWDPDLAFYIRHNFRLLGDFCGTLPKHTAQNQYLTVPLVLSYDEVFFGVSRGFFHVVTDSPDDYHTANGARDAFWQVRKEDEEHQVEEAVARQNAEREKRTAQQNSDTRKRSRDVRDSAMVQQHPPESPSQNITTPVITNVQSTPHAARTSRKRRRERIENQVLTNENVEEPPQKNPRLGIFAWLSQTFKALFLPFRQNPPPIQYPPAPAPAPPPLPQALPSKPMGASPNLASSSHTDKKSLLDTQIRHQARMNTLVLTAAAARPDEKVEDSDVKPFVGLPLPRDISLDRLALRQAVFSDLHDKGYFLSCGAKFGADFLAYPGSPQIFHGSLAVIAVMADEVVGARDVVSLGRLGDSTKKRTILAFLGNSSTVQYVGIQWEETLP